MGTPKLCDDNDKMEFGVEICGQLTTLATIRRRGIGGGGGRDNEVGAGEGERGGEIRRKEPPPRRGKRGEGGGKWVIRRKEGEK